MSHHHPGPAPAPGRGAAHSHGAHDHGAAHAPGAPEHDDEALTELLDLDGEVLHAYLDQATAWIAATAQPPVTRIVDLGAGTGTGTFALLRRFPDAYVTAVDLDPTRLERVQARARDLDLAHRVTTIATDLDQPWPNLGPADLVWASMALHHVADPARTLTQILGLLRPGGSLVVAETSALESFPRFLPAGVSVAGAAPGLEDRVHRLLAGLLSDEVPELGADWGSRLAAAGFEVAADQAFNVALDPPLPARAGRYAQLTLDRLRTGLGDRLTPADQDALKTLVDDEGPASVLHRPDLTVRATRLTWLARRP
ncbi:MAG TPA: methyltransferase [Streptosporangiaceae bacterium]|nr:methyltransferase [Streptosporangiaceae bacterium]